MVPMLWLSNVVKIVVLVLGTPDMRGHIIFRNPKGATNFENLPGTH